jgi:hypothetical protein
MKKLLVCLFLGFSVSCMGMQKNGPRTPSPKKKTGNALSTPEKAISTPEKAVRQAKLRVANCLLEAINGHPNVKDFTEDDLRDLLALPPKQFVEALRQKFLKDFDFKEKGITHEMIEERLQEARESLEAGAVEKNQPDFYVQLSSPLKKVASQILDDTQITLLQSDYIEHYAYATTDTIVINPTKLEEIAQTPRRKGVLLLHENAHVENQDVARNKVVVDLLEERRKANAPSVQAVLANPKEFSPDTQQKIQRNVRRGEVFADAAAACSSSSSADAAARLWEEQAENNKNEEPGDHPPAKTRLKIAQAHANLHAAEARLAERKRQASSSSPSRQQQTIKRGRIVFEKEDKEKNNEEENKKNGGK